MVVESATEASLGPHHKPYLTAPVGSRGRLHNVGKCAKHGLPCHCLGGQHTARSLANGETHLAELIEYHGAPDPFKTVVDTRLREFVSSLLTTMTPDESDVLRGRFRIGGDPPNSYEEIARQPGLSRERVRRIEQRALETLRTSAHARVARTFLETEA
ncbi:RNA polymerase sigma factor RpoD [compost metagenome]